MKKLSIDHPEIATKLKKLEVKTTAGWPNLESQQEGLLEAILSIVIPGSSADDRRRSEVYNSVRSLDDLKSALEKKGFNLSRTATYYRLFPAKMRHKDGKRHVHTVPVKLQRPQNDFKKSIQMVTLQWHPNLRIYLVITTCFSFLKTIRHAYPWDYQFQRNKRLY